MARSQRKTDKKVAATSSKKRGSNSAAPASTVNAVGSADAKSTKKGKRKERKAWTDQDWDADTKALKPQLASLGLNLVEITGDAHQLTGAESLHRNLRRACVEFMRAHEPDFAPFVEDDEPFDRHLVRMAKDGVYGGNMEVVALARALNLTVVIHQVGHPPWVVAPTPDDASADMPPRTVNVVYHSWEHYSSAAPDGGVRSAPPPAALERWASAALPAAAGKDKGRKRRGKVGPVDPPSAGAEDAANDQERRDPEPSNAVDSVEDEVEDKVDSTPVAPTETADPTTPDEAVSIPSADKEHEPTTSGDATPEPTVAKSTTTGASRGRMTARQKADLERTRKKERKAAKKMAKAVVGGRKDAVDGASGDHSPTREAGDVDAVRTALEKTHIAI
ncbi:OTU domain-containing protein 3 [Allomyces arbusculus]|nr:OTU domain-containing protein 3 [Allomyces arbusculus]